MLLLLLVGAELLFKQLLEIFGIPEDMINVIQRLYKNVTLKLNSGSAKESIPYSVGVRQGDVMAPVLFIVLMQAMAESLDDEWKAADIETVDLCHFMDTPTHRGHMHGQAWNTKGTTFNINHILYVDDGMFIFDKRSDMIKVTVIVRKHMLRFGLLMHFGKDGKKSKTEGQQYTSHHQESRQPRRTPQSLVLTMTMDT
jgi:hypothetical protein